MRSAMEGDRVAQHGDQQLVGRIRAGDTSAFEEMYRAHAPALLSYALSQLRSPEAAEDVVQELFLSVWRHRNNWRLNRSIRSYLFGALRNHIISHRRHHQAREGRLQQVDHPEFRLASLPGRGRTDDRVREAELTEAINRAIDQLTPRCKEAFLLIRQEYLSYAEVAEVMGISVKGVEMNMVRALAALRECLAEWQE